MFDRYHCIKHFFARKLLRNYSKSSLTCNYNGAEKHITCERFENATSRAKTNVIATVYFTNDDVSFYYRPGMLIRKTAKPCINSTCIAVLINGFVLVKTRLFIACDNIHPTVISSVVCEYLNAAHL